MNLLCDHDLVASLLWALPGRQGLELGLGFPAGELVHCSPSRPPGCVTYTMSCSRRFGPLLSTCLRELLLLNRC